MIATGQKRDNLAAQISSASDWMLQGQKEEAYSQRLTVSLSWIPNSQEMRCFVHKTLLAMMFFFTVGSKVMEPANFELKLKISINISPFCCYSGDILTHKPKGKEVRSDF